MKRTKNLTPQIIILLPIIFGALTIVSAISIYTTHQTPLYPTRNTTLLTYTQTATYDYTAILSSNTIYNISTLLPGEGPLYTAILEEIKITFEYEFTSYPPATNATTNPAITIEIQSPEKWTRTLSELEARELLQLNGSIGFTLTLNHTQISQFIQAIEEEVGLSTNTYNINIKPEIHQTATITGRKITETFTPQLTISLVTGGDQGNHITIENLQHDKPGQITETTQLYNEKLEGQRNDATGFTALSAIILATTTALYLQQRPRTPQTKPMKKIIAPYSDLITETTEPPPDTPTTININTLEDLAKTAEILARPILHTQQGTQHTFYIIDQDTKYQHKTQNTHD